MSGLFGTPKGAFSFLHDIPFIGNLFGSEAGDELTAGMGRAEQQMGDLRRQQAQGYEQLRQDALAQYAPARNALAVMYGGRINGLPYQGQGPSPNGLVPAAPQQPTTTAAIFGRRL